jgi:hypothetical protein
MKNQEPVNQIINELNLLHPGMRSGEVQFAVRSINRSINRLQGKNDAVAVLKKLAADLLAAFNGEMNFQKLNSKNSEVAKPGEGFFKSVEVLREEILKNLRHIEK